MALKAVIFDYGGTLVQIRRPWDEVKPKAVLSVYRTLKRAGLKLPFEEYGEVNDRVFQKFGEMGDRQDRDIPDVVAYQEIVDGLFPERSGAWRTRTALEAADAFWAVATGNFAVRRETRPALRALKAMKLRMAVLSNHHHPPALVGHLSELRIRQYFLKVLVSADAGVRKPNREIFEMCLGQLRVGPKQAVFVGDSVKYDVEGARNAGIRTILVAGGPPYDNQGEGRVEPDFVVRDLLEVPVVVSSVNATG